MTCALWHTGPNTANRDTISDNRCVNWYFFASFYNFCGFLELGAGVEQVWRSLGGAPHSLGGAPHSYEELYKTSKNSKNHRKK